MINENTECDAAKIQFVKCECCGEKEFCCFQLFSGKYRWICVLCFLGDRKRKKDEKYRCSVCKTKTNNYPICFRCFNYIGNKDRSQILEEFYAARNVNVFAKIVPIIINRKKKKKN